MPVTIKDEHVPDILRSLRALIVKEQADADAHKGESSWASLQNGADSLEALRRDIEEQYEKSKN